MLFRRGRTLGEQGLARARLSVEDDTLGRADTDVLVQLRVRHGQFHGLLDLLLG
jgi:hypothetical protein